MARFVRLRSRRFISIVAGVVMALFFIYQFSQLERLNSAINRQKMPHFALEHQRAGGPGHPSPIPPPDIPSERSASTSNFYILGVAPWRLDQYESAFNHSTGLFECLQSKELILETLFNDDYCDCEDGSDEPSTSACSTLPHSRFFCKNSCIQVTHRQLPGGHFSIPSHRVNDGICDCCDGSDEGLSIADIIKNQFQLYLSKYVDVNKFSYNPNRKCFA